MKEDTPLGHIRHRTYVLRGLAIGIASVIVVKLLYVQVIQHDHYQALALSQHQAEIILRAQRGDILVKDPLGGYATLATDVALNTIYVDPTFIEPEDEQMIADLMAPLLFELPTESDSELIEQANEAINTEKESDESDQSLLDHITLDVDGNVIAEPEPPSGEEKPAEPKESYEELLDAYKEELFTLMRRKEVNFVQLASNPSEALSADIESQNLRGIFVTHEQIYADPTLIRETEVEKIARQLGPLLDRNSEDLASKLKRRTIRYVPIKRGVTPDIAEKIKAAGLSGVGVVPEYRRYYPEKTIASSIIGFINKDGEAQYGIEEQFDEIEAAVSLHGVDGHIIIERDPRGRHIAVGELIPTPARNGDTVVLTIDRVVQSKIEELLNDAVEEFKASGGSVIVLDPYSGAIIAMANYPGFDPNEYWKSLEKFDEGVRAGEYKNAVGIKAFKNQSIDEVYEPGSIFKIITMASGLDTSEVDVDTVHCQRSAVVLRDNYPIRNSDLQAHGCLTMAKVLERSSNLGALWVAERVGRTLFYKYIRDFGYGDPTGVELVDQEASGWVRKPHNWADVDLAAASFGQGLAVTPLQMISATVAIANGGKLMRPYLVTETIDSTTEETVVTKPEVIRQVITPETASKVAAMMVGVVDGTYGTHVRIPGYSVAGKTGTAQIAKGGGYEKGEGTTIVTFVGFAPAQNPRFAMIVKLDRPLVTPWADSTAAPAWRRMAEFLLNYYGVEPDR